MVIVLNKSISTADKENIRSFLTRKGFTVREIVGEEETIFGAVGLVQIDRREVELLSGVDQVIPITKPYKLASREFKKEDSLVTVGPVKIGPLRLAVIAGPCAIESRDQIMESARIVRDSGGVMLRGGAFKPRTSPYAFQGLGEEGARYLKEAGEKYGLPVVTEIVATEHADMLADIVDVLQIGARNMQNFELLKRVGSMNKPIILKRGMAATIEEWLMAAEYLMAHGAENVILCERGIRTFETYTRNTLDLSAIPVIKKLSHLPVIVDPSHATGIREKVIPMGLAAVAAGADGLVVEVHPDPEKALSDGPQSLLPEQFEKMMRDIEAMAPVVGRELERPVRRGLVVLSRDTAVPASSAADGPVPVGFQGEHGAYSEKALSLYFSNIDAKSVPLNSFRKVFDAVLQGEVRYGVVPMENSLAGSIHENYDLFLQYPDIKILGERRVRIRHTLIGRPGAGLKDIRKVYSHPQGLAQCARFLDETLPEAERVPYYDTAGSVGFIAGQPDNSLAAIASEEAAVVNGMVVLKEGIETNPSNYTRFFIIGATDEPLETDANTASLVFAVPDKSGALFSCLKVLADRGINMKKLESRPILGKPWEYMFYLDVELPGKMPVFDEAVEALKGVSEDLRVLGVYRS
ncbi:3-deoxy-7-phosphoheptulonate synthase [Marispirochaeta aestuarii]|uniref:3-deoxy-7-phosphoheptulonate synthase n=1 Tax=Marispirochaeta aestuarii TaxID=1963862 RepID=UPI0029C69745|nr:3-deoxy-7-phosphoheptulonate synthase [Marispirochaeta aestuarii]